jgi:Nif-specific regulatory protein
VERAVLTATDETIRLANLPPAMRPAGYVPGMADDGAGAGTEGKTLAEMSANYERSVISASIEKHRGNLSAAARALGISPRMIYYKMGRLGVPRDGLARKAGKMLS